MHHHLRQHCARHAASTGTDPHQLFERCQHKLLSKRVCYLGQIKKVKPAVWDQWGLSPQLHTYLVKADKDDPGACRFGPDPSTKPSVAETCAGPSGLASPAKVNGTALDVRGEAHGDCKTRSRTGTEAHVLRSIRQTKGIGTLSCGPIAQNREHGFPRAPSLHPFNHTRLPTDLAREDICVSPK